MKKLSASLRAGKRPGVGRAHICYPERHTAGIGQGGTRHPQFNPTFQVEHQDEPTDSDPRRQHVKMASSGSAPMKKVR